MRTGAPPSLKSRAMAWLAQREHSRVELRRKLLAWVAEQARREARAEARNPSAEAGDDFDSNQSGPAARDGLSGQNVATEVSPDKRPASPRQDAATLVDDLLDELQARELLSSSRFIESRVHARSARFGNQRIRSELARHGERLDPETAQRLSDSELARAQAVWLRKFREATSDPSERARQARFLSARGFSPDVVRRVVRGAGGGD